MAKNIALSDDAVKILERLKRPGESYSDVVKRVAVKKPSKHDWRKSFGAFKDDKEISKIYEKILSDRHIIRKRRELSW